ncbi:MAG: hypothetical protein KTR31_29610 [Myxococcales bacterium]|nr:hypothetical protein [Myxococcales bacterium]
MRDEQTLFETVVPELEGLIKSNAVVGRTISVDGRHAVPLVELTLSLGGGGGRGEGDDSDGRHGQGSGAAAGGGAKATPVAVLVIENGQVHINALGH